MIATSDPYRIAVKNDRKDRALKRRKEEFKKRETSREFLNKKIYIRDIINLPDGLATIVFTGLFITIPYLIGTLLLFIAVIKINLNIHNNLETSFAFSWVVGYELIASLLILGIIVTTIRLK